MDDERLISHLKKMHDDADTKNFNVLDFVSAFGNPLDALAYSKLFWPDFVEFEGMIFLKDFIDSEDGRSAIRAAISKFATKREVEQSFNQFLIPLDFFAARYHVTNEEESIFLATQLMTTWKARLAQQFPQKKFVLELTLIDENDEGPTIVVCQE